MNKINFLILFSILILIFSCQKDKVSEPIISNDGMQMRSSYVDKGYTEVEVEPIVKINCYFEAWEKEIETPVSGLFEYYDSSNNWVASIDFGDGSCDEWATKSWDVTYFPDFPTGQEKFSVFKYLKK